VRPSLDDADPPRAGTAFGSKGREPRMTVRRLLLALADADGGWRWTMQDNAPVLPAE
jgi:hypothetical protein